MSTTATFSIFFFSALFYLAEQQVRVIYHADGLSCRFYLLSWLTKAD